MSPLPSGRVVHPRWAAHHRPTVAGAMTASCTITAPQLEPEAWTAEDGLGDPAEAPVLFEGPCRIQAVQSAHTGQAAAQSVTTRLYSVEIDDADTVIPAGEDGAMFTATACDDPQLAGRTMRVVDVQVGSLRWARILTVRDDQTNEPAAP